MAPVKLREASWEPLGPPGGSWGSWELTVLLQVGKECFPHRSQMAYSWVFKGQVQKILEETCFGLFFGPQNGHLEPQEASRRPPGGHREASGRPPGGLGDTHTTAPPPTPALFLDRFGSRFELRNRPKFAPKQLRKLHHDAYLFCLML